ncbi:MAG TPA: PAS domain-containing protein, partial [Gemmatimonadaceae bacterium]|nr:PAS domain-containing protein [Gemmatimonadaceae bacterium]
MPDSAPSLPDDVPPSPRPAGSARAGDAARLLRRAQDFAALVEHSPDSVVRIGADMTYVYANPATAVMLGVPREAIVGEGVGTVMRDERARGVWQDAVTRCFASASAETLTLGVTLGGSTHWVESRFVPEFEDDGGAVASVLVVTRDVTWRRREAEALERLAALVRSSDDAIVGLSLDGRVTSWNAAAERIFGYSAADAVGQSWERFVAPHVSGEACALRERVVRGEPVSHPSLWHRRKDGREIPIALTMAPVRDAAGVVVGISSIERDMSAQLLLEAQLREAQKMEAVGRLAGGVAHDFNNLLTAIIASAELALVNPTVADVESDPAVAELREDLAEIRSAGVRAAALTKQLLAFSRRQVLQPRLLDVNEVIASAERLLRRAVGAAATTRLVLGDDVPFVVADRGQLEQVLLNLALNARDAMHDRGPGGTFTLETSSRVVEPSSSAAAVTSGGALPPVVYAVITASDTGVGMDAEVAARVFEPFFTTKEVGKGTGLGLAMAYGIVTQSGGRITA